MCENIALSVSHSERKNYAFHVLNKPFPFNVNPVPTLSLSEQDQRIQFSDFSSEVIELFKELYQPESKRTIFNMILTGVLTELSYQESAIGRYNQLEQKYSILFSTKYPRLVEVERANKKFRSKFRYEFEYLLYHTYVCFAVTGKEQQLPKDLRAKSILVPQVNRAIKKVLEIRANVMADFEVELQHIQIIEKNLATTFPGCRKKMKEEAQNRLFGLDKIILSYSPFFMDHSHININLKSEDVSLLTIKQLPGHLAKFYQECYMYARQLQHARRTPEITDKKGKYYISLEKYLQ